MAPTGPVLGSGDLLADRYRLERLVSQSPESDLWQATDEVLARLVAVTVVPADGPRGARTSDAFLHAAALAGAVSHPGLARVYDAALERVRAPGRRAGSDVAYVVSEWVEGRPLQEVLADGPLAVSEAAALGVEAAEALAAAHRAGFAHGRLHPGNVLLTAAGRVRVTDTATAAALHPARAGDDDVGRDTRDLAAVTYAALTGRWPGNVTGLPARGLPEAPTSGDEPCSPRQVRAGVPRSLDQVVARALERPTGGRAAALAAALAPAAPAAGGGGTEPVPAAPSPSRRARLRRLVPRRLRRLVPLLIVFGFLVGVGATTFAIGRAVGALPARPGDLEALATPTPSAQAARGGRLLDLAAAPVVVQDFDPYGDQNESHSTVVNSFDKDPSTAWVTSRYNSAGFGGLKSGVGLLVDLGRPTKVRHVDVTLTTAGGDVELRAADLAGTAADPLPAVVASAHNVGGATPVVLTPPSGTTARYWLIWLTHLPADPGGGYREGVSEMSFSVDP